MKPCDEGFFTPRARFLFAALAILAASAAIAQQATTLTISSRTLEVENFLRQGRQLELQRRWGEAVTCYEDALRLYPDEQSLERRFESARLHYDLGRRYADRSFCRSLTELSPQQALDLYAGVLLKIQTHYVEEPNWRDLVACGASDFEMALGEPVFSQQNIPARDWPAIEPFRAEVRKTLAARTVATRQDACDAVAALAALAQQRLEDAPGRGDPRVPLRGGQRPGSVFLLPHPGPARRGLFADRGEFRRPGGRARRRRGASWSWCGSSAAALPKRPASAPRTASWPSTAAP